MHAAMKASNFAEKAWHTLFLSGLPTVRKCVTLAFRHLSGDEREEAMQEAIAKVWVAFAGLVAQGRSERAFPSALARFAIAQVRVGRTIANASKTRDVMSPYTQRQKRIFVERLDRFDSHTGQWREAAVEDHRTPVPDQASFRIDFPGWLATLPERDRQLAEHLAAGHSTSETAERFSMSHGRVSQLRREFHDSWQRFHGQLESGESRQSAIGG